MNRKNQHITYSASDIARYIAGEMNPEEMHRLEMQAMDDPFLADALDGYKEATKQYGSTYVMDNLPEENLFPARKKQAAILPLYKKLSYAAAVIVVFSIGLLLFRSIQSNEKQNTLTTIHKNQDTLTAISEETLAAESSVADTMETTITQKPPTSSMIESKRLEPRAILQKESSPVTNQTEPDIAGRMKDLSNKDTAVMNSSAPVITMSSETLTRSDQEQITITGGDKLASVNKMSGGPMVQYKGKVTNRKNEPLQFATVELTNIRQQFLTDQDGKFNFYSRDSLLNAQILLDGYQGRNIMLRKNANDNAIVLKEASRSLKQPSAEIARNRSVGDSPSSVSIPLAGAVPDGGWIAFERYIDQNKKYSNSKIHGEVELYFELSPSGKPINIDILKSLSAPLDNEAIRLIQEGPYWKSPPNSRRGARLTIAF